MSERNLRREEKHSEEITLKEWIVIYGILIAVAAVYAAERYLRISEAIKWTRVQNLNLSLQRNGVMKIFREELAGLKKDFPDANLRVILPEQAEPQVSAIIKLRWERVGFSWEPPDLWQREIKWGIVEREDKRIGLKPSLWNEEIIDLDHEEIKRRLQAQIGGGKNSATPG